MMAASAVLPAAALACCAPAHPCCAKQESSRPDVRRAPCCKASTATAEAREAAVVPPAAQPALLPLRLAVSLAPVLRERAVPREVRAPGPPPLGPPLRLRI